MAKKVGEISSETMIELYKLMLKTRKTEDRLISLYRQGKIVGGVYTGRGMEAITVASGLALKKQDYLYPIHRDMGAHLAKGQSVLNILLQYLGKGNNLTKGKDSGLHASDLTLNIVGNISHLGAMIPVATGTALSMKLQKKNSVALNFIGEGGSNIGDFHEALNLAAVQSLPFVLIIENNQYAYSTPTRLGYKCEKLSDRSEGYGIPGHFVDGTDALKVYNTVKQAVEHARKGNGPTLIEAKSMRMVGHSAHDDASYVDKKLLEEYKKKDPVLKLEKLLSKDKVLSGNDFKDIENEIDKEIETATKEALDSPSPEREWAAQGVFTD